MWYYDLGVGRMVVGYYSDVCRNVGNFDFVDVSRMKDIKIVCGLWL